ncbi:MAG TPA: hypothetical protein VJ673_13595 [Aromatoleum sp.]|uniref:hypothetical protein n=1 Tax=Aromatoleum sp. TaxID=2307007 RepID=UPI002B463C3B|nr:hypothetical protein [Aromatoleum sp.]HJV26716.1 hypothetical protein [Aromatoleum sp.]
MSDLCPVCDTTLKKMDERASEDRSYVDCPRCGPFSVTGSVMPWLKGKVQQGTDGPARMSYALRRMTNNEQWALLDSQVLDDLMQSVRLPKPAEQLNLFVQWLGDRQPGYGDGAHYDEHEIAATIGASNQAGLNFVLTEASGRHLISTHIQEMLSGDLLVAGELQLTFAGWALYDEIQRGHLASRTAFMAMKFGDTELDSVFRDAFVPAVKATGFNLLRLDEVERAGLIDDKLRVEIRQSRFLIADLSHHNNGAYWEAGFAEGLGKPVIYTCRRDVFNDKTKGTHFDTNHHLTIVWEPDRLEEAAERLKATIRATLPDEARFAT